MLLHKDQWFIVKLDFFVIAVLSYYIGYLPGIPYGICLVLPLTTRTKPKLETAAPLRA
jgi:hypothetical protein